MFIYEHYASLVATETLKISWFRHPIKKLMVKITAHTLWRINYFSFRSHFRKVMMRSLENLGETIFELAMEQELKKRDIDQATAN